jgi:hypothetical protein
MRINRKRREQEAIVNELTQQLECNSQTITQFENQISCHRDTAFRYAREQVTLVKIKQVATKIMQLESERQVHERNNRQINKMLFAVRQSQHTPELGLIQRVSSFLNMDVSKMDDKINLMDNIQNAMDVMDEEIPLDLDHTETHKDELGRIMEEIAAAALQDGIHHSGLHSETSISLQISTNPLVIIPNATTPVESKAEECVSISLRDNGQLGVFDIEDVTVVPGNE